MATVSLLTPNLVSSNPKTPILSSYTSKPINRLLTISSNSSLFSGDLRSWRSLGLGFMRRVPVSAKLSGLFDAGNVVENGISGSISKSGSYLNDEKLDKDIGLHSRFSVSSLKCNDRASCYRATRNDAVIEAKKGNPPIMPAIMTPGGPVDLSSILFCNRIIFIGQPVNSQVAQRVISQLVTLAAIDEDSDILMYLNCPGGSTYSVLAIYDCMSWIKPKVGTVCFGVAASQGALLLAGGEKGMRYAMPNARIMIHQPQSGCGGHVEDVRRQVNEAVQTRHKVDRMYSAFTGQPLEKVQQYTERDRFLSSSEAFEFGLIDGVLETEY